MVLVRLDYDLGHKEPKYVGDSPTWYLTTAKTSDIMDDAEYAKVLQFLNHQSDHRLTNKSESFVGQVLLNNGERQPTMLIKVWVFWKKHDEDKVQWQVNVVGEHHKACMRFAYLQFKHKIITPETAHQQAASV